MADLAELFSATEVRRAKRRGDYTGNGHLSFAAGSSSSMPRLASKERTRTWGTLGTLQQYGRGGLQRLPLDRIRWSLCANYVRSGRKPELYRHSGECREILLLCGHGRGGKQD